MGRDLRITEGEHGFNHEFIFPSGTDLTWITTANLIIKDGTATKLNITTNLTISGVKITWAVQLGQTDFDGRRLDGTFILTGAGPRREEIHFPAMFIKKT